MTQYTGNHGNVVGRAVGRGNGPHTDPVFNDETPWASEGLCADDDSPDDWFEEGDNERALKTCRRCPVQLACLTYRMDQPEATEWGIWGGTLPQKGERYYARRLRMLVRKLQDQEENRG